MTQTVYHYFRQVVLGGWITNIEEFIITFVVPVYEAIVVIREKQIRIGRIK